ncbi:D-alanyl-D-alanine carboxypeptidase / D-alanyl-D-alanine-endopeptidase (penicillin-binding protein 4) [Frankineae bacterium MT45]|nr:D-alanyl-D-alanine carboxypeptidase / D-alanyl-D-alanine-endopeptidase (penicillin-binding protein 4) [Frankineae bacterium MT45]
MLSACALGVIGYLVAARVSATTVVATPGPPAPQLVAAGTVPTPTATPLPGTPASPQGVAAALAAPLADPRLGGQVLVEVLDTATGAHLLDKGAATATSPASTAKLATTTALLSIKDPDDRITTRVVAGQQPGSVVLVGAGDPTLTGAKAGAPGAYPDAARISDLAAQLMARPELDVTSIVDDTSLFTGPAISPDWDATDVPTSYGAPITALMVDGGRDTPTSVIRSADPATAAGRALAVALGLPATAVSSGVAPAGAATLASVESPPLSELVEQALIDSDNVIAEQLARQVALAAGQPASFTGAATAVSGALHGLGVNIAGALRDGSGLARSDRLSPAQLAAILQLAASDDPSHDPLHDVLSGLPVAGWDGTLAYRFLTSSHSAAGLVRAKTGTLTSVSALAGVVHDASGRQLTFALMADKVGPTVADTTAAEAALDSVAAALAGCGCS